MNCIIVDDEPLARKVIADHLESFHDLVLVGEFSNAIDAHQFILNEKVELLFLDINMPKMNGLELLKNLIVKPYVVLTTAYQEYAIEAFELDVFDYLLKPISLARFSKTIMKLRVEFAKLPNEKNEHNWLSLKKEKDYIK